MKLPSKWHNHDAHPSRGKKRDEEKMMTKQAQHMKPTTQKQTLGNTCLFKYIEIFTTKNTEIFQIKIPIFFHIFAQTIDRGYSLEPPHRGGSNEYPQSMFWAEIRKIMYTPVNPSFTI